MAHRHLFSPKMCILAPLLSVLILAVACGGEATPAPTPTATPLPRPAATPTPVPAVPAATATAAPIVPTPTPAPTSAPAVVTPTGTLTILTATFPREAIDNALSNTSDKKYNGHMFDYLIGTLPGGELTGERGLARSWEISPDARALKLNLRQDVRWHDGRPFGADDVVFSVGERYRAKDQICTFCGQLVRRVSKVVAIDPKTAEVQLVGPDLTFFGTLGSRDTDIVMLPRHNFNAKADGGFELVGNPIGTGAWKFVERKTGESITYEANLGYWNAKYRPEWARLRVLLRPEPAVRLAAVRAGEADMAEINAEQVPETTNLGLRVGGSQGFASLVLAFHVSYDTRFFTSKLEFRKALNLAIDMDAVVKAIYPPGTATRAATAFWNSPVASGYDPNLKPYPYDPDEARRLLKQAGYDGTPLKVWSFPQGFAPETPEILELAAGYWEQVGIKVEITPLDFAAFRPRYVTKPPAFEGGFAGHIAPDTPPTRPLALQNMLIAWNSHAAGGVIQSYHDLVGADAAYETGQRAASLEELGRLLREFNRKSYSEYPTVPIVLRNDAWALGPTIASWEPGDFGLSYHFETIRKKR